MTSSKEIDPIHAFWQAYLESLPKDQRPNHTEPPEAWGFGDSPEVADELGALVLEGLKTATCSLLWAYEFENETPPVAGELSIITDGADNPLCIIETSEVQITPYNQVGERHAYEEGEGDRSLAYWREVHWRVFSKECAQIGRTPQQNMPLVCERFRVLFTIDAGN